MKFVITVGAVLFTGLMAFSDEPLTEHEKAAKEFSFDKVKLGTSLSDFKKSHPNAKPHEIAHNDKQVGLIVLLDRTSYGVLGAYRFLDGKLYDIRAIYNQKTIRDMGGNAALVEKVHGKLGETSIDAKKTEKHTAYYWLFPKVDRFFSFDVPDNDKDDYVLCIMDSKLEEIYQERLKKNAKTGLDDK